MRALKIIARWLLAGGLVFSGLSHLFWARRGFRIAVPDWATKAVPIDKDGIVVASGAAEIGLGVALVVLPRERMRVAALIGAFFVAVFPGNLHQWQTRRGSPGMRTDRARFIRLFLQPVLVAWAIWVGRD